MQFTHVLRLNFTRYIQRKELKNLSFDWIYLGNAEQSLLQNMTFRSVARNLLPSPINQLKISPVIDNYLFGI